MATYSRFSIVFLLVVCSVDGRLLVPDLYKGEYVVEGDINLGAILDLSQAAGPVSPDRCSSSEFRTLPYYILQYTELMSFCTREINQRTDLLPNVTIGFVIKDTCSSDLTTLARGVYLAPDQAPSCTGNQSWPRPEADKEYPVHRKVAGIIGPLSSRQSVAISPFTSVFQIPTLSTWSTSDELMDKTRFEYFLRMVPTDSASVQAIFDVIKSFGWSYIAVLYSDGSYGEFGFKAIVRTAKKYDVCIAVSHQLLAGSVDDDFEVAVDVLERYSKAKVVVAFGDSSIIGGMFRYMADSNRSLSRVWLGGDSLCNDYVYGALCFEHPNRQIPSFANYVRESVSPWTRPKNPWLKNLWTILFSCSWQNSSNHCNMHRRLDEKIPFMTSRSGRTCDCVSVYAHALHDLISSLCPHAFTNRSLLDHCVTGPRLLSAMKNVSFQGVEKHIEFGPDGELKPEYLIFYSVESKDHGQGEIDFFQVGEWVQRNGQGELYLNRSALGWFRMMDEGRYEYPESVCSKPCGEKQYQIRLELKCCWNCHDCQVNEILVHNRTGCDECPAYWWPDEETALECRPIPPKYLRLGDPIANGLAVLAIVGAIASVTVIVVFYLKRHTRLVKASNRQLSTVMLVGATLACFDIFTYLVKPTAVTCGFRLVGFHFVVNLLYSPLFVKTYRIYRIFAAGRKGDTRPRFISSNWQSALVCVMIGTQVILLGCVLVSGLPRAELVMPVKFERFVEMRCVENMVRFLLPLCYNVVLVITCAFLGYYARKLPENFNESWYIFISVSTTLFMWVVFLPTYFTSFYSYNQVATLGFCLLLNVYITIGCLYLPKIYALYFVGELNLTFNTFTQQTASVASSSRVAPAEFK